MRKHIRTVILTALACLVCTSGCAYEVVCISPEDFSQKMSESGLSVYEAEATFSAVDGVDSTIIAQSAEGWRIEYYICADNDAAFDLYEHCVEYVRSCKGSISSSRNYGSGYRREFNMNSDMCGYVRLMDNCVLYALETQNDYLLGVSPALGQFDTSVPADSSAGE